jgi:hypothetical protein
VISVVCVVRVFPRESVLLVRLAAVRGSSDSIFGARERHRVWRGADRDQSVIALGESVRLMRPKRPKYLPRYPSDCQRGKKCAESTIIARGLVLAWRLAGFPRKRNPLSQKLEGTSPGVLALWTQLPRAGAQGVVFPKLSKLLNQEDA